MPRAGARRGGVNVAAPGGRGGGVAREAFAPLTPSHEVGSPAALGAPRGSLTPACSGGHLGMPIHGSRRAEAAADGRAQGTQSAGPSATPAARARLVTPRDGAQRGGAIGLPVRRSNAQTRVQPHFGVTPLGGKTAVARQRGRRPPQILAARGSPLRG